MRTLLFDSLGGASGDMVLAALLDLGVSRDRLMDGLAKLNVGCFDLRAERIRARGLSGFRVDVERTDSHHERGLREIRALIENAGLPSRVAETSIGIFQRLAEAEATVHGIPPERVHFHEIGAVDSIIDIVGSCLALDMLDVSGVAVGILPLGRGSVKCGHGLIPVPAPATLELLKGMPVLHTEEPFELVTPTGAALLSAWRTMDIPRTAVRIIAVGSGFGHRDLSERPNLLRAVLLDDCGQTGTIRDECLMIECNIDDCQPELIGSLSRRLLEAGALEVFTTPVFMKKQRPGVLLSVLCAAETRDIVQDTIFRESTTFGIREHPVRRTVLERVTEEVLTCYGPVRMKTGIWQGKTITRSPEHEDCARLARGAGVPIRAVYEAALRSRDPAS